MVKMSNGTRWEDRNPVVMVSFCTKCRWTMMVMVTGVARIFMHFPPSAQRLPVNLLLGVAFVDTRSTVYSKITSQSPTRSGICGHTNNSVFKDYQSIPYQELYLWTHEQQCIRHGYNTIVHVAIQLRLLLSGQLAAGSTPARSLHWGSQAPAV